MKLVLFGAPRESGSVHPCRCQKCLCWHHFGGQSSGGFSCPGKDFGGYLDSEGAVYSRNIPQGITSLPEMDLPGSGELQQWAEESWGGLTSKNSAQTNQIADLALDKEV